MKLKLILQSFAVLIPNITNTHTFDRRTAIEQDNIMRLYIPTFYLSTTLFLCFTAADHTLRGSADLASVELDTIEIDNEEPDIVKPNIVEPDIAEPTNVDPDIGEPNIDSISTYNRRSKDSLYRY